MLRTELSVVRNTEVQNMVSILNDFAIQLGNIINYISKNVCILHV